MWPLMAQGGGGWGVFSAKGVSGGWGTGRVSPSRRRFNGAGSGFGLNKYAVRVPCRFAGQVRRMPLPPVRAWHPSNLGGGISGWRWDTVGRAQGVWTYSKALLSPAVGPCLDSTHAARARPFCWLPTVARNFAFDLQVNLISVFCAFLVPSAHIRGARTILRGRGRLG